MPHLCRNVLVCVLVLVVSIAEMTNYREAKKSQDLATKSKTPGILARFLRLIRILSGLPRSEENSQDIDKNSFAGYIEIPKKNLKMVIANISRFNHSQILALSNWKLARLNCYEYLPIFTVIFSIYEMQVMFQLKFFRYLTTNCSEIVGS